MRHNMESLKQLHFSLLSEDLEKAKSEPHYKDVAEKRRAMILRGHGLFYELTKEELELLTLYPPNQRVFSFQ